MNNHAVEAVKEKIIDNDYFKDIISQSIIFRSVEKIIKSSDVPAYRSQVCTYTVSLLSNLSGKNFNLAAVWQDQRISNELNEMLILWVNKVYDKLRKSADSKNKNPSEWFKKMECWKELKNQNFAISGNNVPIELKGSKKVIKTKKFIVDDYYKENMKKCKSVSPNGWLKIAEFIQDDPDLSKEFHGMCLTLKDMANDDWYEDPTPHIAEEASAIIDLAVDQGIIRI